LAPPERVRVVPRLSPEPEAVTLAVLAEKMDSLNSRIGRVEEKLDNGFVTNEAFWPVKTIVYGGAGIVGSAVLLGVLGLLFHWGSL